MSKIKAGKKAYESVSQYFSKLLGRPVGLNESATKVQAEAINKQKMKNKNKDKFLVGGQAEIDADGNGVINSKDFEILRAKKKKFGGMAIKGVKENPPIY